MSLCLRFPSLNPFIVDRYPFHEVMELFRDSRRYDANESRSKTAAEAEEAGIPAGARTMVVNGQIYVEAQNDDWY